MKWAHVKKRISRYVDGDLSTNEKEQFVAHVLECPTCRKELEEVEQVHRMFASAERFEVPPGFAARVMARIEEREKEPWFSHLWWNLVNRPFLLRTAEVALALMIMLIGMISGNMVVDRTHGNGTATTEMAVRQAFSLDLFEATPSASVAGAYARLSGEANER